MSARATGSARVAEDLRSLREEILRRANLSVEGAAYEAADIERALVPFDANTPDGIHIRNAIEAAPTGPSSWKVGPTDPKVYYAVWVEWGRKNAAARPFAGPTSDLVRSTYPAHVVADLKKVL